MERTGERAEAAAFLVRFHRMTVDAVWDEQGLDRRVKELLRHGTTRVLGIRDPFELMAVPALAAFDGLSRETG